MKNESTAINFDQEADMLYPTLNEVEELLKDYQMVPVFYEVLADYMTPIRMFQALRKEGTPCFMLESVENKDQWGRYSFIGINPKSEIKISGKELEVDGVKQEEEFKMSYLSDLIKKYKSPVMEDYPKLTGGLIGAPQAAGRYHVRRRAADAGHGPCAHEQRFHADAGRALHGPVAPAGAGDLRHHPEHPQR